MSIERMGGAGAVLSDEFARAEEVGSTAETVILVEGASDRIAVETLAGRLGRDLGSEGIAVIAIAGATNIGRFLDLLGPTGHDTRLAGLCDAGEADEFGAALGQAGLPIADRSDMERHGFFVCDIDLEDELIRSLGAPAILEIMGSERQLRSFRRFQSQPAQREKTIEAQIWRWLGNHKIRYASLMVEALDIDRLPLPLKRLLAYV